MAPRPRFEGPSDAPAADRGRAIIRRLPIEWRQVAQLARRLAASVVEQRWKAVEALERQSDIAATMSPAISGAFGMQLERGR